MRHAGFKRSTRVANEIYHVLAEVCHYKLSDPRVKDVQLTHIELTDDLQLVKAYYYVEGSENDRKKCLKGLESARGFFKKNISDRLDLRVVPDIRFYFDEGMENVQKMDNLLKGLNGNGQTGEEE